MMPYHIPMCLADGSVIHSEWIGNVQFTAIVHGQEMIPLEFTNVIVFFLFWNQIYCP